jgi:hypothetical protein
MAQLTFFCPYTNKPIPSGVEIDSRAVRAMGKYPVSVRCPHCETLHHGFIADGCIAPDSDFPPEPDPPKKKH